MTVISGVPDMITLVFAQNTKGVFHCDKVSVEATTEQAALEKMDYLLAEIKKRLLELNMVEQ